MSEVETFWNDSPDRTTPLSRTRLGQWGRLILDAGRALVATDAADPASALGGQLAAQHPMRAESPRGTSRVRIERRPTMLVDRLYPSTANPFRILHAAGNTLWGFGTDFGLRKSTDRGATWGLPLSNSSGATWAKQGLFIVTAAGSLLTTSHPADLSAPKIIRSTDGVTWSDVVAAQTSVDYLGATSMCQDPVSGYLYLVEYVTVSAATKATWRIMRSTDDGATWAAFATFQRDATAHPTTAVRHGHAAQWDPVSGRVHFLTGDSEAAAGIYRVNAAGDGVEKVVLNSETTGGNRATAVGVMFFPTHITWGMDASSDSYLLRLPRTAIGAATPADVEAVARLQSTAWYTCRVASDGTEWVAFVSNEVSVGRVDAAVHLYRVGDNGATVDEVLTIPTPNDSGISYGWAVGSPLQSNAEGLVWLAHNVALPLSGNGTLQRGQQFAAILGWGAPNALHAQATDRLPYGPVTTQSSGYVQLAASEKRFFGVTEVPAGATRLYIIDAGREQFSGSGFLYVEVYDQTGGAILKMEDGTTNMQWQNRSRRAVHNAGASAYLYRSAALTPGRQIRFRLNEVLAATADGCGYVTYAWGI